MDVSLEDFKQTKKLQVNWVPHSNGSDPDGSEMASTIFDGKISNRRCLGMLHCENPDCKVVCQCEYSIDWRDAGISGNHQWGLYHGVYTRMDGILGSCNGPEGENCA